MHAAIYEEFLMKPGVAVITYAEGPVKELVRQTADACDRAAKYYARHGNYEGANEAWDHLYSRAFGLLDSYERLSRQSWIILLVKSIAEHMSRLQRGDLRWAQHSLADACELVTHAVALTPEGASMYRDKVQTYVIYRLTPFPRKSGTPTVSNDSSGESRDYGPNVVPFPIPRSPLLPD